MHSPGKTLRIRLTPRATIVLGCIFGLETLFVLTVVASWALRPSTLLRLGGSVPVLLRAPPPARPVDDDFAELCGHLIYEAPEEPLFSQFRQDWILYHNFFNATRRGGRYVDVGASHWMKLSNTVFFDKCLGWEGVCVEPNPRHAAGLRRHRSCMVFEECVWPEHKTLLFDFSKDVYAHAEAEESIASAEDIPTLEAEERERGAAYDSSDPLGHGAGTGYSVNPRRRSGHQGASSLEFGESANVRGGRGSDTVSTGTRAAGDGGVAIVTSVADAGGPGSSEALALARLLESAGYGATAPDATAAAEKEGSQRRLPVDSAASMASGGRRRSGEREAVTVDGEGETGSDRGESVSSDRHEPSKSKRRRRAMDAGNDVPDAPGTGDLMGGARRKPRSIGARLAPGKRRVTCRPLEAMLEEAGISPADPIDLLSVDIEGAELDILSAFPWARWRNVFAVCVESNHVDPRILDEIMLLAGFSKVANAFIDDIYVRRAEGPVIMPPDTVDLWNSKERERLSVQRHC